MSNFIRVSIKHVRAISFKAARFERYHNKMVTKGFRAEIYRPFDVSSFIFDQIGQGFRTDVYISKELNMKSLQFTTIKKNIMIEDNFDICAYGIYKDKNGESNRLFVMNAQGDIKFFWKKSTLKDFDSVSNFIKANFILGSDRTTLYAGYTDNIIRVFSISS
ncbi:hypothetical protein PPL_07056 [Heterostelium album PN500]|uniref:Uncharacterized protein n=1 Tax=Heterostelium pallidum (strain ATCC 26659 / Pp 5 / PN500) TaxID=670386 RepID=D3BEA0_HETP5|nr:hypothetical protein PPL_07056 [Heterostelium album PN500]EFA80231.1 hypothetical protein PPL_07056 [Heterostelium album PN500]|eukprot:XP_020432351.1 hypothetical protein PPL_07056 [Heterostelium album PN500]